MDWGDGIELLVSRANEYQGQRYVLVSYEGVAAFRVMGDTDQLNIQYYNYSKSWCNVRIDRPQECWENTTTEG